MRQFIKRLFGSANERFIRSLEPLIRRIHVLEASLEAMDDETLKGQTPLLRARLEAGESLDDILPDAFATVREVSKRVLGMRHFDVQMKGGIVLHRGVVAEMKTGEGKTLVATLPVYLNALTGKGVHVVTVNDYLATRDAEWMGKIYNFLGLTVGCIVHGLTDSQRQAAYQADITYGTNNEFGFDYLRDNMKFRIGDMCQRPFNYAIVDEVDSILIDEARTPLIISGPAEDSSTLYTTVNNIIPQLTPTDYEKDEKNRSATFTESGTDHLESLLRARDLLQENDGLYNVSNMSLLHHLNQALKAHKIFSRDVDYIIKDGKVILIDEFTGRMMEGRRYSDGLHQAIEAKENVQIEVENQTLASITFQNYFRLYPKLSGMTGTAMTEATELSDIYNLDVAEIPTHKPIQRKDADDEVYLTFAEKIEAVVAQIEECRARKQPVLVGTVSIEKSEVFAAELKKRKIPHQVLNARYHETEARIIAEAGIPGAVTIATNIAGRGTDIKPGGSPDICLKEALSGVTDEAERQRIEQDILSHIQDEAQIVHESGGLFVIGTERHESRRIDNQLRGRTGRQGDPGASKFYLSLEDDLMRIFGSERLDAWLRKLGLKAGEAITHPWINRALEKAQKKVEARNYDTRKHLLKYDNVMNDQRKAVYAQRREYIAHADLRTEIAELQEDVLGRCLHQAMPPGSHTDQWDISGLHDEARRIFNIDVPIASWTDEDGVTPDNILEKLKEAVCAHMAQKESQYGADIMRMAEHNILLRLLDHSWKDHLHSLDHLRQGVHLRSYAQKDPLNEYKQEAFVLFEHMLDTFREEVVSFLCHFEVNQEEAQRTLEALLDEDDPPENPALPGKTGPVVSSQKKPSRNALCPCGSGKRFKSCHGRL